MTNLQMLMNAIVAQAADDYKNCLTRGNCAQYNRNELETFFKSDWCGQLTDVDGTYIMKKCQEEVAQKVC